VFSFEYYLSFYACIKFIIAQFAVFVNACQPKGQGKGSFLHAPKKRNIKIFSDISPDHRGREKYTRNFAPRAVRMLRTGFRHASLAEPGCALCVAHPTRKPSPFGLGFLVEAC
jgi:hypothetical protein